MLYLLLKPSQNVRTEKGDVCSVYRNRAERDNAQYVYLTVFVHGNVWSISLEFGHDTYLFIS